MNAIGVQYRKEVQCLFLVDIFLTGGAPQSLHQINCRTKSIIVIRYTKPKVGHGIAQPCYTYVFIRDRFIQLLNQRNHKYHTMPLKILGVPLLRPAAECGMWNSARSSREGADKN